MNNNEKLIGTRQACEILGVTDKVLSNWRADRKNIPFYNYGRLVMYRYEDVIKFKEKSFVDIVE